MWTPDSKQGKRHPGVGLVGYQAVNRTPGTPTVVEELYCPDMLIWAEGTTFYIGEDKVRTLYIYRYYEEIK